MVNTSKIKWFGSIILAGTLLALALMGGKWGTDFSVNAGINLVPYIESITPSSVPAGSPYIIMIISGSGFGDMLDTRVRLTTEGFDELFEPLQVLPDGISVMIPAQLLLEPKVYTVTVVWSSVHTIPELPPTEWDEESNPKPFTVFNPFTYLPIITNVVTR
jgi:hypothetical protein